MALDKEVLEAALQGLELQKQKLDQQIAEVRSLMGTTPGRRGRPRKEAPQQGARATKKKRTLSPEARKRIAAAQKKRWASFRKTAKTSKE